MPKLSSSTAGLSLQERDLALLRGLFESRVLATRHIEVLYFEGRREATKKRLQKLKAIGLVGERNRRAYEPAILFLNRKGLTVLQENGFLNDYPKVHVPFLERRGQVSVLTLNHELEVMDVKSAYHAAVRGKDDLQISEFSTWPSLYQFQAFREGHRGQEVLVKPDGFIRMKEVDSGGDKFEHTFFLEVDRSTETQDTLVARASCYLDYHNSGEFAVRNGGTRSDVKDFPFRVLMVLKTAERRNNTAERLMLQIRPIRSLVWVTTFEEVTSDPLGPIWVRPGDYCEALRGTRFQVSERQDKWGYKRQTERETLVEERVPKKHLFES